MDREEIVKKIEEAHIEFVTYINTLAEKEYIYNPKDKWSSGQHTDHILKSIDMLNKALKIPKFILKLKFGKANRPSKTYDELVLRYLERLKKAKATPKDFQPKEIPFSNKNEILNKIEKTTKSLIKKVQKISEKKLDYYILPHPLLGKQTFREQLYFSIHHVKQHQNFIKRDLLTNKENNK